MKGHLRPWIEQYRRTSSRFRQLTGSKTGIIQRIEQVPTSAFDPHVHFFLARPCNTAALTGIASENQGAACSMSMDRAFVRACGEVIERYASAFYDPSSFVLESEEGLRAARKPCVSTSRIYPYAPQQYCTSGFPFESPQGRKFYWTEAVRWKTEEEVLIPASCIYLPYVYQQEFEPITHATISTGLAAGVDLDECIQKAVLEVVERDAFMVTWNARLPTTNIPECSCYGVDAFVDATLSCRPPNSKWYISDIGVDVDVPTIAAALVDRGSCPMTSFGVAANVDPVKALVLALEEALLTRIALNRLPVAVESTVGGRLR